MQMTKSARNATIAGAGTGAGTLLVYDAISVALGDESFSEYVHQHQAAFAALIIIVGGFGVAWIKNKLLAQSGDVDHDGIPDSIDWEVDGPSLSRAQARKISKIVK